jgi:hypothetical protein
MLLFLLPLSNQVCLAAEPVSEQSEQFFDLPLNGTINLENTDGTINVVGWYVPRVRLAAVRKAYTPERLQQIRVETTSQADSLLVRTVIPQISGLFADRSGTVDYTVTAPETSHLVLKLTNGEITLQGLRAGAARLELINGRITAIDCFAQVEARATNGVIEVVFEWWENHPANFNLFLRQGPIMARVPADSPLRVEAQTNHGWIHNSLGLAQATNQRHGQSLKAAKGPGSLLSLGLRTGKGNISLDAVR